jgi:hypothetical protein
LGILTAVATSASAATALRNHNLPGQQVAIGCVKATLCDAVGQGQHGGGVVIPVRNGTPGGAIKIHNTGGLTSISCPNSHGCVAVAEPSSDTNLVLVKINGAGKVDGTKKITLPSGVTMSSIACTTLSHCILGGTQFFTSPMAIEIGFWNGTRLALKRVHGVAGHNTTAVHGVGCHGTLCWVVGSAQGSNIVGFAVPIHKSSIGTLRTARGDSLTGVGCSDGTHCYASGEPQSGGNLVALSASKIVKTTKISAKTSLFGIACARTHCTAVGQQVDTSTRTTFAGTLFTILSGKVTSSQEVKQSGGYSGVTRASTSLFAAVGSSNAGAATPSEVTTN